MNHYRFLHKSTTAVRI